MMMMMMRIVVKGSDTSKSSWGFSLYFYFNSLAKRLFLEGSSLGLLVCCSVRVRNSETAISELRSPRTLPLFLLPMLITAPAHPDYSPC